MIELIIAIAALSGVVAIWGWFIYENENDTYNQAKRDGIVDDDGAYKHHKPNFNLLDDSDE